MAVKSENPQNEIESTRSDSIGCSEAYKELQETSSVELLRNSIFRSISKMQTIPKIPVMQKQPKSSYSRRKAKSDLSLSSIEVKFLEKYSSMDSRLEIQSTHKNDMNQLPKQPPNARQMDVNPQNSSNHVQEMGNGRLFHATHSSNTQISTETKLSASKEDAKENSETDGSGKNSLKLVFRTSNNTIFEDCSTYNINCNEVFGSKTRNGLTKGNGLTDSGSKIPFGDREKLLDDGFFIVEPDRSPDQQSEVSEDQPSLCDTFFSKVNNGDYAPITNNSAQKTTIKKLTSTIKSSENKEIAVVKDEEVQKQEDAVDGGSNGISKISRRIRKRNRKSQSNEPHVYECPQCGVSYTISTDLVNDAACCLHCDLWTSVEPEFLKREKQPWNTCRIC
ncbi:hypothetical protein JTE90_023332 [Oedothorax gibbosus]|uniref:Uncharacterized protein n=1 Tax=Oedothorax gibbosus TaxID=931172 RepID=A0AAV6VGS8_9ARAC|nr:hypothetical protein JTE90_023332 [Oedothorax gibbosus]